MARRKVILHLGLPATGAAFIEQALLTHTGGLAAVGVDVPATSSEEMFRAALEIRRDHKDWGYRRSEVEGTWAKLCRRIFRRRGTAVVSHELLAAADPAQAALLLDGLAGREVHVVLTVRDPGTQLAAGWEEAIKAGGSVSFATFQRRVLDPARDHEQARKFWAAQDLGEVLERWGPLVGPHRVHLIVVPHHDDARAFVWREFADVVGFDPETFRADCARGTQRSLGVTEVAVLSGVNQAIDGRIDGRLRRTVVKRYFADRILGDARARPAPVPAAAYADLMDLAEKWQKQIANAGHDVRGSLDDLLPPKPEKPALTPDEVPANERLRTTTDALANVLVEVARLREHNERLEVRNAKLEKKKRKLKRRLELAG